MCHVITVFFNRNPNSHQTLAATPNPPVATKTQSRRRCQIQNQIAMHTHLHASIFPSTATLYLDASHHAQIVALPCRRPPLRNKRSISQHLHGRKLSVFQNRDALPRISKPAHRNPGTKHKGDSSATFTREAKTRVRPVSNLRSPSSSSRTTLITILARPSHGCQPENAFTICK
ncbi:hypothetical protein V8G54_000569 [Vigna mungo]|uniref:Uncharacterized protein n=1 Tax=Vigna mungo TaxID=3915 RepID=A0AAQ3P617_VIGMU